MIEPNETESLERLDGFVEAMRAIARECRENPEIVRAALVPARLPAWMKVKAVAGAIPW